MKKNIKKILLLIVFIAVLSGCSFGAGTDSNDGTTKEYILSQSVWKSTDGGKNWEAKNKTNEKPAVTDLNVLKIAINPFDNRNIFVGLQNGGMIKTEDGGDTWKSTIFTSEKVYGLEIDPKDGRTMYVSGVWEDRGKIFKSEDKGENWKEIYTSPADGPLVIALALDKNNSGVIYAATSDEQVIKSVDAGLSWKNVFSAKEPVVKIALDKSNSNLLYLLTTGGNVLRSADAGASFEDITAKTSGRFALGGGNFKALETDPNISGGVYLAGSRGILKSENAGETWEKVYALNDPENFPITAFSVRPGNKSEMIYSTSQAVYRSVDGGVNWSTFQFNVPKSINMIIYDSSDPNTVYLGFRK
ncbi:MAG TPA: lipoprotein [Candidatus Moranbacteria bacterium]|nr:lipoprotein [Candidatus Moranbacteria bacterium]